MHSALTSQLSIPNAHSLTNTAGTGPVVTGESVGAPVGDPDGVAVGGAVGMPVIGEVLGAPVKGDRVSADVGFIVVGFTVEGCVDVGMQVTGELNVGPAEGVVDGAMVVREGVGFIVGVIVGVFVRLAVDGKLDGEIDGDVEGSTVGDVLGVVVGATVGLYVAVGL